MNILEYVVNKLDRDQFDKPYTTIAADRYFATTNTTFLWKICISCSSRQNPFRFADAVTIWTFLMPGCTPVKIPTWTR